MRILRILLSLCFLVKYTYSQQSESRNLEGPYLDQNPPGMIPEVFAPGIVSKPEFFEHSAVYLTPDLSEMYWLADSGSAKDRKLIYTKYENRNWSSPTDTRICEHYSNSNIGFSTDGNRIYFTSRRPLKIDPEKEIWDQLKDSDIWYADRINGEWCEPVNFTPLNTVDEDILGAILVKGNIYYSDYKDIYKVEMKGNEFQKPEKLDYPINTEYSDLAPYVPEDESYILFESMREGGYGGADLYISFKGPNGEWTQAINLGDKINSGGHERSPFLSPDKKYLFFWRVTNGSDIYWVSADLIEELKLKEQRIQNTKGF